MTPEQVQKDLELVLAAAGQHALWKHDPYCAEEAECPVCDRSHAITESILRLRALKLVAVEEAPEGVPSERFVLSRTYHSAQAFSHWCYFPMIPEDRIAAKYIYAGDVVLEENGKVDG